MSRERSPVDEFLSRQRQMYAGGDMGAVAEMLAEDVVWHVPGRSPIAGEYRGHEAVLGYFRRRRELAGGEMRVTAHGRAEHEEVHAELADGEATLAGEAARWRTVGAYRIRDGKVAEAWLVPTELAAFDRAWSRTRRPIFTHSRRVNPQDCAGSEVLGHPRFFEFFEEAFVECCRQHAGGLQHALGLGRRLGLAEAGIEFGARRHASRKCGSRFRSTSRVHQR